jgi:DNA-binding NarL/FixJ family response regulator
LGTVREYLGRLYRRLKCTNRTGAVGAALEAMGRMMREGNRQIP